MTTLEDDRSRVPNRAHYNAEYFGYGRHFSMAHQVAETMDARPRAVLEVGVGSGLTAQALRTLGVAVTTLDIEESLAPDIVGSVLSIPCESGAFDVALCCQVLEHLPFERFGAALRELRRVVNGRLVLSLPDSSRRIRCDLDVFRMVRWRWSADIVRREAMPLRRLEEMGHHWEIGYRDTPLKRVAAAIRSEGWSIERTWRVNEIPWHRFFRLSAGPGPRSAK